MWTIHHVSCHVKRLFRFLHFQTSVLYKKFKEEVIISQTIDNKTIKPFHFFSSNKYSLILLFVMLILFKAQMYIHFLIKC